MADSNISVKPEYNEEVCYGKCGRKGSHTYSAEKEQRKYIIAGPEAATLKTGYCDIMLYCLQFCFHNTDLQACVFRGHVDQTYKRPVLDCSRLTQGRIQDFHGGGGGGAKHVCLRISGARCSGPGPGEQSRFLMLSRAI